MEPLHYLRTQPAVDAIKFTIDRGNVLPVPCALLSLSTISRMQGLMEIPVFETRNAHAVPSRKIVIRFQNLEPCKNIVTDGACGSGKREDLGYYARECTLLKWWDGDPREWGGLRSSPQNVIRHNFFVS